MLIYELNHKESKITQRFKKFRYSVLMQIRKPADTNYAQVLEVDQTDKKIRMFHLPLLHSEQQPNQYETNKQFQREGSSSLTQVFVADMPKDFINNAKLIKYQMPQMLSCIG